MMGFNVGLDVVLFYFWVLFCVLLMIKICIIVRERDLVYILIVKRVLSYGKESDRIFKLYFNCKEF